jgi:hypothetical protein
MHRLLREGAESPAALARIAIPMSEADFLDLCEERALAGRCGSPLCKQPHSWASPEEQTRIDWGTRALVKTTAAQHWCSPGCHAKCAAFAHRLGSPVDRLDILRKLGQTSGVPSVRCIPAVT